MLYDEFVHVIGCETFYFEDMRVHDIDVLCLSKIRCLTSFSKVLALQQVGWSSG